VVGGYDGVVAALQDPNLVTAAGTIVAVDARHASYVTFLNDEIPFPDSFETLLTPQEVMERVGPFMTGGDAGTPESSTANVGSLDATPAGEPPFAGPVDVLQFALALEHLESACYRDALSAFDERAYADAGYQTTVREYIAAIAEHELDHVERLAGLIDDLGEEPVGEASYAFDYADLPSFLATAAAIENLGVSAYTGAAQSLVGEDDVLTTALTIHGVESRHAAYLNLLTGAVPFPNPVDAPQPRDEVLAAAGAFMSGESGATPAASSEA
jgi:hypothetical protein